MIRPVLAASSSFFLAVLASASTFSVSGPGGAIPDPVATPGTWNVAFTGTALRSSVQLAHAVGSVSAIRLHGFHHSWRGDVHAYLEAPDGTSFNLIVRPGFNGTSVGDYGDFVLGEFVLVPSGGASLQQGGANLVSGNYQPYFNTGVGRWNNAIEEVPLAAIHGPAGTWQLVLEDWGQMDTGGLSGWTFEGVELESSQPFCAGDGLDHAVSTPCPCGNTGSAGRGCANSVHGEGASLAASGRIDVDSIVLHASGLPATASAIFLQGDARADVVFGDGVRCVGGVVFRLRTKVAVSGAAQFPENGDPSLSSRGGVTPGSGTIRYYQAYYRNAAAFCSPATFNVTNGWIVVW